ncbi:hypothetical protein [Streptomyces sp. NPDC058335]|uniref:hypothetical protein n=1 Tax=Streptomyces sp. NPDC058335 TaxID=3346451 RepID=UPI0036664263
MLDKKLVRLVPAVLLAAGALLFPGGTPASAASSCSGKSDDRSADNWASTEVDLCLTASAGGWSHGDITFGCWKGQAIGWNRTDCGLSGTVTLTETREGTTSEVYSKYIQLPYSYAQHGDSVIYSQDFTFHCTPGATYNFTLGTAYSTLTSNDARVDIPDRTISALCN